MIESISFVLFDPGIPIGGTKGASVHVKNLSEAFARLGIRVRLYATSVVGTAPVGVELIHLPFETAAPKGVLGEAVKLRESIRFTQSIRALESGDPSDLYYERLSLFFGNGSGIVNGTGALRLIEVNAPVSKERYEHFGLEMQLEAEDAERSAFAGADAIAVSESTAQHALSMGARSATVIPNGVDLVAFALASKSSRAVIRNELGISDAEFVVGFVGSLKPWHGVQRLLDALRDLSPSQSLTLLLVGDGPMRKSLLKSASLLPSSLNVVFAGAQASERIPSFFSAMDVSVAPYEPNDDFYFSPLKVVESLAAGVPVIAADFEPIRRIAGESAIYFEPGSTSGLTSSIIKAIKNNDFRNLIAASGKVRTQNMGWDDVAQKILGHTALIGRITSVVPSRRCEK